LDGQVARVIVPEMAPDAKLVLRVWGRGGSDEFWVYDSELNKVSVFSVVEAERRARLGGRKAVVVELDRFERAEPADSTLASRGTSGVLVPCEKTWVEAARTGGEMAFFVPQKELREGEFVAPHLWRAGGAGYDLIRYFDGGGQEVLCVDVGDIPAEDQKEGYVFALKQQLAAKERELESLRHQAHGKPGSWARRNIDPVEDEVWQLREKLGLV